MDTASGGMHARGMQRIWSSDSSDEGGRGREGKKKKRKKQDDDDGRPFHSRLDATAHHVHCRSISLLKCG